MLLTVNVIILYLSINTFWKLGLYLADMTSNAEMPTFIPNAAATSENTNKVSSNDTSNDLLNRLARTPLVNYNKFRITGKNQ